jgi:signal transduction histidine kinase/CheY-like chemotaxis protein/HPt (histidine-containing phosphotransfer) domain-containing protein
MRALHERVTDDVLFALVRSLFKEARGLIIGSLIVGLAMIASYARTANSTYLVLGLLFAAVTVIRVAIIVVFNRQVEALSTREDAVTWERSYAVGAIGAVFILGCWCFVAMAEPSASGVQLLSFTLTMGYIIGIFGRNFGSASLVSLQILCAWLMISASLIVFGDSFHWLFAALLVPLFLGIKLVADRIRSTLLEAVLARNAAEEAQIELAELNEKLRESAAAAVAAQRAAEAEARQAKQARARALLMAQRARQSRLNEAEAIQARDEHMRFLATMSHEIRTPLNGIAGVLELMTSAKSERIPQLVDMAKLSADSLLDIVTEVLDLSRLEYGQEAGRRREYDIKAVLKSVKLAMEPVAKQKGLSLTLNVSGFPSGNVVGDPAMVRQICMNLVGNALKFTDAGFVQIALAAKRVGADDLDLEVRVSDSGCGIQSKDLDRIFEPFYTAGNKYTRGVGSSGLGLAIVKKTVDAMGGAITCESRPGQGTTFRVSLTLPMGRAATEQAVSEVVEPAPVTSFADLAVRTLLVEDNEINAQIIQDFFEDTQMIIKRATDGLEALSMLEDGDYDLVLMDISMPGMDGVEALRRLRSMPGQEVMPKVIALTAHAVTGDRERYIDLGFDEYVAKPVRRAVLIDAICRVLVGPAKSVPTSPNVAADADITGPLINEDVFDEFLMDRGVERANDLLFAICDELERKRVDLEAHSATAAERESLIRDFHNLASIVGTVGAEALASVARSYEQACMKGQLPDSRQMSMFMDALKRLKDDCRSRAQNMALRFA